jgi:hypothetical protein
MAYAWSEALRQYPHIDAKILVSPREDAATRVIDTRGTALKGGGDFIDDYEYDAIFHLFSESKIPNLLTLKQFSKCKKHIFLTDEKTSAISMRVFTSEYHKEFAEIKNIDPNNPRSVFNSIARHLNKHKKDYEGNLGFNVTGGTKPMMAGALDACRAYGIVPFYYGKELVDFTNGATKTAACLNNVDEIVRLNMDNELKFVDATKTITEDLTFKGATEKITEKLFNVAKRIMENRGLVERHYRDLSELAKEAEETGKGVPFAICQKKISWTEDKRAYLALNGTDMISGLLFNNFPRFLSGDWLELYAFSQLEPLKTDGLIKDIRLNYTVSYNNDDYNEVDVLFTDGQKLYFVECKAGEVKLDAIDKVKNTAAALGGDKAIPIIVAATVNETRKIPDIRQRKMKNLGIKLLKGEDIPNLTEKFRGIIENQI